VLIVTDGTGSVQVLAERIAVAAGDCKVLVKTAADFAATDILPADICFFGCEEPGPPSFSRLEEVLRHINLAGRSCGLFSPASGEAAAYLSALILDSEISAPQPPFVSSSASAGDIGGWARNIINCSIKKVTIQSDAGDSENRRNEGAFSLRDFSPQ
jgi:hypothetical protein